MSKLTIPSEDAQELYHEQDTVNGLRHITTEFVGEWRWGNNYELIVQDVLTEKFYAAIVKEQTGDTWYLSLEEEDEITFYEVKQVEVTTYKYEKVKDDS